MVNPIIRPATTVTTASRMEKAKKPGLLIDPSFSCSKVELFILAKGKVYYSQLEALNLYSSVCKATAVVTSSFILLGIGCGFSGHIWERPLKPVHSPANFGLLQFYITIYII